jgi:glucokinase
MAANSTLTIGIDVGGTNIRFGVFNGQSIIDETRVEANLSLVCSQLPPEHSSLEVLRILSNQIIVLIEKHDNIQGVGIGFPGFIHPDSKKIVQSPNLPGLRFFNLAEELSVILDLPVVVENDAVAAAYGEYCLWQSAQNKKTKESLIYIGLGTGVGGGLIHAGKLFLGQHGVAMEVGHMIVEPNGRQCGCGNKGCMEQYVSASGVAKSYFQGAKKQLTANEIAELARKGDKIAIQAFELAARILAQTLANIIKVVDVKNVVIGGGLVAAWPLMQAIFTSRFEADLIPILRGDIKVAISTAQDKAGMLGAAMLALR